MVADEVTIDTLSYKEGSIIERGDAQTVSKHLQEIRKFAAESTVGQDILTAYTALSKQLIRIAQQKHPHKDYKHLEKELEQ